MNIRATLLLGIILLTASFAMADDERWFMNYYKQPKPEEVNTHLIEWQRQGLLKADNTKWVMLGFLCQVMRDNPKLVKNWLVTSESFSSQERDAVLQAAWFSNGSAAISYFKEQKLQTFLENKPPSVDSIPIEHPSVLDFYWSRYFASGNRDCIRTVISALKYQTYSGALDKYKTSQHTEQDKKAALYDTIFQSAMWSLESNCKQDEKVYAICKDFLFSNKLSKPEQMFLGVVLSKVRPDDVKVELPTETGKTSNTNNAH